MNLYLRLLLVFIRNISGNRQHHSHICDSRFRVLPHDLDAFGHMNNGRYLQIMDVARTEWMMQTGVFDAIRSNRWAPILGGGVIRYRHSMRLWQNYRVQTRLLGWDDRWFYLEHCFLDSNDRYASVGITRAGLRKEGRWVKASEVARIVDPEAESPAIPAHVLEWLELEEKIYQHGKDYRPANEEILELQRVG